MDTKIKKQISNELLYLYNTGKLYHAYRTFGAQLTDGGVQFTLWVPNVKSVRVIGDFNGWGNSEPEGLPFSGEDCYMKQFDDSGIYTTFLPGIGAGCKYKFEIITGNGSRLVKTDPYAFSGELRPNTASIVTDMSYTWGDDAWLKERADSSVFKRPLNIYEIHLGSWMRHPRENGFYTYDEIAEKLVPYIKEMGYTHIEILPVMEHPLDASWGYQVTGYFAATSRFGSPDGLMRLVDKCHQEGIGVILDWVPGHFCPDEHGLAGFNGGMLYESEIHPDWGTYKFNFGKNEVRSFLLSNAMFWLEIYHIDGLRVDGVSSMLYLNFGKSDRRQYKYNKYGEETDLEAVSFIREFNEMIGTSFPGAFTAAEESSAFPMVTWPPENGGLGFHYKWNMGWMNDTLDYMSTEFDYRRQNHNKMTFSMSYAFSENYILPLSHDEVVHGKKSLIGRLPGGDQWREFAGLRALFMYQLTHPGKKLNFMGHENAPYIEWREYEELEWFMLQYDYHAKYREFVKTMNHIYKDSKALWMCDDSWDGFRWIDPNNGDHSIFSYVRCEAPLEEKIVEKPKQDKPAKKTNKSTKAKAKADEVIEEMVEEKVEEKVETYLTTKGELLVTVLNFGLNQFDEYRIGVPCAGEYEEIINTDDGRFGGNNRLNSAPIKADKIPMHGMQYSVNIKVPVIGGTILKLKKDR